MDTVTGKKNNHSIACEAGYGNKFSFKIYAIMLEYLYKILGGSLCSTLRAIDSLTCDIKVQSG